MREEGTRPGPVYRPDADILERAEEYVVRVDLPGADEQSVQVRFDKDVLTIEANAAVAPDPAWTLRHVEYQPGGYAREFRIADGIDVEAIRASAPERRARAAPAEDEPAATPDDPGRGGLSRPAGQSRVRA